MKIRHKIPRQAWVITEPVSEDYQREVDRATTSLERQHAKAVRNLARAELRLASVRQREVARQARSADRHALTVALELVELRREELLRIESMMHSAPASAMHRGRKGYRPVPPPGSVV